MGDGHVSSASWAKAGLDLVTSLLNTFNSTSPAINGIVEVSEWLGREGVDRHQLTDCLHKAKGLAYPNDRALAYLINDKDDQLHSPLPGLYLRRSHSLASRLLKDPDLCWLVSFTAGLFQTYRDKDYISNVLTMFILDAATEDIDMTISPSRIYIQHTIDKIVSSIFANVVNVRSANEAKALGLPPGLQTICPRGHHVGSEELGHLASRLARSKAKRTILSTKQFLSDITLWVTLHFDGLVRVIVSGRTLYNERQGFVKREIEIRVGEFCSDTGPCGSEAGPAYTIYHECEDKEASRGSYHMVKDLGNAAEPGCRKELYVIPQRLKINPLVDGLVRRYAQDMMQWILDLEVVPPMHFLPNLCFTVEPAIPRRSGRGCGLCVADLLKKQVPDMIHKQWGGGRFPLASVLHISHCTDAQQMSRLRMFPPGPTTFSPITDTALVDYFGKLLHYFPPLQDIDKHSRHACSCYRCTNEREPRSPGSEYRSLPPPADGCQRFKAIEALMLLLAHGIADCLGCEDASGLADNRGPFLGMALILIDLYLHHQLDWDFWFATVASVYLGCPFQTRIADPQCGGSSLVAVQQGSLAIMAPWLDMTKQATLKGCFGMLSGKGRLGVINLGRDEFVEFRGVETDFAYIQAAHTETTRTFIERFPKQALTAGQSVDFGPETGSEVAKDIILMANRNQSYLILIRIRSKNHNRIIDPTSTLVHLTQILPQCFCSHGPSSESTIHELQCDARLYTFDEILGRWGSIDSTPDSGSFGLSFSGNNPDAVYPVNHLHVTLPLDTHLKLNVAYALSFKDAALLNRAACFSCAQGQALHMTLLNRARNEWPMRDTEWPSRDTDRFIINVAPQMQPHRQQTVDLPHRRAIQDSSNEE